MTARRMTERGIAVRRQGQSFLSFSALRARVMAVRPMRAAPLSTATLMAGLVSAALLLPAASQAAPQVSSGEAHVSAATPSASDSAEQRDVAALLSAVYPAAQRLPYEGTFVFQRGSTVQSSRVIHFVDGMDDQYQKIDGLDGEPRSVIQHNADLFTFLPATQTVILDRRKSQDNFPALLSAGSARVLRVYHASFDGNDRVAGVDCRIVSLKPNDAFRFAYRLFIARDSGLLIRAQTLGPDGQVLEQVAFSQLQVGALSAATKKSIRDSVRKLAGWKQVRAPAQPVDMEAAGWTLDGGVAGFEKVLELRRPMAARDPGAPPVPVDQAVFTDGVTTVSLFIEPVDKSDRKPGEGRAGATHLLAEQHGRFWLTLIGEVPAATLRQFATSIQYRAPK